MKYYITLTIYPYITLSAFKECIYPSRKPILHPPSPLPFPISIPPIPSPQKFNARHPIAQQHSRPHPPLYLHHSTHVSSPPPYPFLYPPSPLSHPTPPSIAPPRPFRQHPLRSPLQRPLPLSRSPITSPASPAPMPERLPKRVPELRARW